MFCYDNAGLAEMVRKNICNTRRNGDIAEYNEKAKIMLSHLGVEINDLYESIAHDIKKYICEDMIHLTEEGRSLCAKKTANAFFKRIKNRQKVKNEKKLC